MNVFSSFYASCFSDGNVPMIHTGFYILFVTPNIIRNSYTTIKIFVNTKKGLSCKSGMYGHHTHTSHSLPSYNFSIPIRLAVTLPFCAPPPLPHSHSHSSQLLSPSLAKLIKPQVLSKKAAWTGTLAKFVCRKVCLLSLKPLGLSTSKHWSMQNYKDLLPQFGAALQGHLSSSCHNGGWSLRHVSCPIPHPSLSHRFGSQEHS